MSSVHLIFYFSTLSPLVLFLFIYLLWNMRMQYAVCVVCRGLYHIFGRMGSLTNLHFSISARWDSQQAPRIYLPLSHHTPNYGVTSTFGNDQFYRGVRGLNKDSFTARILTHWVIYQDNISILMLVGIKLPMPHFAIIWVPSKHPHCSVLGISEIAKLTPALEHMWTALLLTNHVSRIVNMSIQTYSL